MAAAENMLKASVNNRTQILLLQHKVQTQME